GRGRGGRDRDHRGHRDQRGHHDHPGHHGQRRLHGHRRQHARRPARGVAGRAWRGNPGAATASDRPDRRVGVGAALAWMVVMSGAVEHPAIASMVAGTVRYVLSCTALDVGDGERVILADHRILPLSWTRDAYYQAQLLLATAPSYDRATETVAGHLRWLWGRARHGNGWRRGHLPDGRPRDQRAPPTRPASPTRGPPPHRAPAGP